MINLACVLLATMETRPQIGANNTPVSVCVCVYGCVYVLNVFSRF